MTPEQTALILIGFQNDYFASDGILYRFIEESSKATQAVANTVHLLDALAQSAVSVIATPIFFTANYEELVDPVGILKTIQEVGAFQMDSRGSEMITELEPFREQILEVPGKRGFNAFTGTNLEGILQQRQIQSIVLAGAVTSVCIDSTGRSAHERGYEVTVLSDCTSARDTFEQEFYIENVFPLYAQTLSSAQLLASLGS
ncbi:MAG: cysteine hydrolase [Spirulina sp. SIO3F2]|nr:cysteine hydrolase [Spirulina sp. SIO3F2]